MKPKNQLRNILVTALAFACLVGSSVAHAQPIFNESGPALNMTAFPDSVDPNLYYLAPTSMQIAHDSQGTPEFSYMEEEHFFNDSAIVQTAMTPFYDHSDVETAEKNILSVNPHAHFASLPFVSSSVIFDNVIKPFVKSNDCNHPSGLVGQDEICNFELTSKGANVMKSTFKTGLTITIQFQYVVEGVIQKPDKTYDSEKHIYAVAGTIGGAELSKFPQLFRDAHGNPITRSEE